jgi:uncharacterized membrane protein
MSSSPSVAEASRVDRTHSGDSVRTERVQSVDVLRGLVMVIMALDHVREFFSSYEMNPLDPSTTFTMMYFTRWITHLCAPAFVFLAGTSIYLQAQRKPRPVLSRFLLTRGLWLMALDVFGMNTLLFFHWSPKVLFIQVLWVIGLSMVCMAGLVWLPPKYVAVFGAVLVLGHNLLDGIRPAQFGLVGGMLWHFLHVPGTLLPPQSGTFYLVLYPLIPWPGIMALGYAFGALLKASPETRVRRMLSIGAASLVVFAIVRWINVYGDPSRWEHQATALRTMFSFFNVTKYPPSLLFTLSTMGFSLLIMAACERAQRTGKFGHVRDFLSVYGKVPFFYYLLHFGTAHLVALVVTAAIGKDWRWWVHLPPNGSFIMGHPDGYGFSLLTVYLTWMAIVLFCYPLCKWYAGVKQRNRSAWLSYL